MKARTVIADEQRMIREMLSAVLERAGGHQVVGQAGGGIEAVDVCRRTAPDLLILELRLPELSGVEVLRRVRQRRLGTKCVIYTSVRNRELIGESLCLRPSAFVSKSASLQTLQDALRAVASGGRYFAPPAADLLEIAPMNGRAQPLSGREREIIQLVAESSTNKEIAARLGLAVKTVENHRASLMAKLHLHDVAALTRYAVSHGLIDAE